jgi:predicted small lipoprotein YifL
MKQASWILIVCASVPLAGCGMKGPLYLPDKNASVVTRPGSGTTTTTTPPAQTAPGSATAPTAPAPGEAVPSTPPKSPQDKSNDDSQSTGSTPKN